MGRLDGITGKSWKKHLGRWHGMLVYSLSIALKTTLGMVNLCEPQHTRYYLIHVHSARVVVVSALMESIERC